MNENEFQNYQFLEDAAILSLNGTWRVLREKLNKKISKIKETDSLDHDGLNTLVDALNAFDKQIRKAKSRTDEPTIKSATKQVTRKDGTTKTQRTSEEAFEEYIDEYFSTDNVISKSSRSRRRNSPIQRRETDSRILEPVVHKRRYFQSHRCRSIHIT